MAFRLLADVRIIESSGASVFISLQCMEVYNHGSLIDCVKKKRDLFPMDEMNLKFNKITNENFRIPEMLFDSLDVYLRHLK